MDNIFSLLERFLHILHVASEPVTVTLAVVAIVYAAIQKRESRQLLHSSRDLKDEAGQLEQNTKSHTEEMKVQRNAMEGLTREMRTIATSMSTKYIGIFPKNMRDICEVVSLTDRTLDIQVDLVAYGHYSDPEAFQRYVDRIEEIARKSPQPAIRLLVYSDETAQTGRASQFGGPEAFSKEMDSERYRRYFRELYKCPDPPATYGEFVDYMAKQQREWRSRLERYNAVEIRYASFPFRLFVWIEDQEEAVFAFELYGRNRTISFRTRDGNLIRTFGSVFEQNWADCAPKIVAAENEKKPPQPIRKAS
ncbi:MAG: hypothetical protein DMG89_02580 [Acidobacteria bacterium]|nr:MAG: hypothetical protein DMG89_02580 [Acidobacteriota bacterium]